MSNLALTFKTFKLIKSETLSENSLLKICFQICQMNRNKDLLIIYWRSEEQTYCKMPAQKKSSQLSLILHLNLSKLMGHSRFCLTKTWQVLTYLLKLVWKSKQVAVFLNYLQMKKSIHHKTFPMHLSLAGGNCKVSQIAAALTLENILHLSWEGAMKILQMQSS